MLKTRRLRYWERGLVAFGILVDSQIQKCKLHFYYYFYTESNIFLKNKLNHQSSWVGWNQIFVVSSASGMMHLIRKLIGRLQKEISWTNNNLPCCHLISMPQVANTTLFSFSFSLCFQKIYMWRTVGVCLANNA